MKAIRQIYTIHAPVDKVWEALVDPRVIEKWGGGPAKMSGKVSAAFSFWGGDIHGKNLKIVPKKLIQQEWISKDNDKPGTVTFELKESGGVTTVTLTHEGISDESYNDLSNGWKNYYLGPIKKLLES
ncbi:SRPBCC domain-containing protein [Candidatus Gottesmanbacteria bacterium]|nr:SRPBCC domain-containing protein [Candidatus Gottesmanbacteria bacterium]